jgi:hypothetical protein
VSTAFFTEIGYSVATAFVPEIGYSVATAFVPEIGYSVPTAFATLCHLPIFLFFESDTGCVIFVREVVSCKKIELFMSTAMRTSVLHNLQFVFSY